MADEETDPTPPIETTPPTDTDGTTTTEEKTPPPVDTSTENPDSSTEPPSIVSHGRDPHTNEFVYYGAILKEYAPTLSSNVDRDRLTPWIRKLFQPEYQTSLLKGKRNRYLAKLLICVLNDEASGIFLENPPRLALDEIKKIKVEAAPAAQWEMDKMWQDTLSQLPASFKPYKCLKHSSKDECRNDTSVSKILDQEFQFFLYLIRPYAAMLATEDRTRIAAWIQALCTIAGKSTCASMKAVRNDYMVTMLGYLHDLRVVGPFLDYPPTEELKPVNEAIDAAFKTYPVTDPTGPYASDFLKDQPLPEDGAFCYIALTGDLIASNM